MTFSLYEITVPSFIHYLKSLSDFLKKGESHFAGNEAALIDSRLIANMEALPYQIQRISDSAKNLVVRVGNAEPVKMKDNEKTFPELQERIKWTIEILEKLDPKCMDGMEDREITLKFGLSEKTFTGKNYVLFFANAILRKEGVPLGKMDYLGVHLGTY